MFSSLGLTRWKRSGIKLLQQKIHIAIVGSGPSGFYTGKYLLDANSDIQVDFYDKLPFPYGLVRYGVAPDHPEVKSVHSTFDDLFSTKHDRTRLFCNVSVGNHKNFGSVSLSQLSKYYDSVVLAYGAESDHDLGIENEHLPGILSARSLVNWYNAHPEFTSHNCARVLAKPVKDLNTTDIASHALQELSQSAVETITVIGRRGHVQASFTIKELRELTKIDNVKVVIQPEELKRGVNDASTAELENNRPKKRIVELIETIANTSTNFINEADTISARHRSVHLRFLLSPTAAIPASNGRIGAIRVMKNALTGDPFKQGATTIKDSPPIDLPCDLLLKSVGYKSVSISDDLPFDPRSNTILHDRGKIRGKERLYTVGWLKRGPSGIIGTNIPDAKETVASIIADLNSSREQPSIDSDPIEKLMKECPQVYNNALSWEQVSKLMKYEEELGKQKQPPKLREKLVDMNDIMHIVHQP
jgi:adrenodoxin-NADP+ reductase